MTAFVDSGAVRSSKSIFISLPDADLAASTAFYKALLRPSQP